MSVDDHATDHLLTPVTGQQIGQYRLDLGTGTWWWSSETYRVHGFEPGEVVPTTELVLAHKHPDDRERVRAILRRAGQTGEAFASVHRIMDAHGREKHLVLLGQGRRERESGEVVELMGYVVDVTARIAAIANERARHDIEASARSRGGIEQAKGVLMGAYGIDADEAFARIRHCSNNRNVPLRDVARVIVDQAARSGTRDVGPLDEILQGS